MKSKILGVTIAFILLNTLFWLIFSSFSTFNYLLSTGVVLFNYLMIAIIHRNAYPGGAKISLPFIVAPLNMLAFVLALISKSEIRNNLMFALILILLFLQISLLILFKRNKIVN
jgi:hypothetical protein